MYPNQNDMTGMEQNRQSGYQQNNTGYDTCQQNNTAHDTYQNQGAPWQNMGDYQNNIGYQNNDYGNNGCNEEYAGGGYRNYNNYQTCQQLNPGNVSQLELEEPVKVGEWMLTMLLMCIPCVNIIMMFVFAFSKTEKKSKSNFFKAYLIWFAIMFALMILFWFAVVFMAALM